MTPAELVGLGPGCAAFDLAGHEDPETIRGPHGGIVYAMDRGPSADGEVTDLYLWAEPYRDGIRTGQLEPSQVRQWSLPNDASVRSLVRRCCTVVMRSRGALDTRDLQAVEIAFLLTHLNRRPA